MGGAIGALLGLFAYKVNERICRSELAPAMKIVANLMVGATAIVVWMGIGVGINMLME